MGAQGSQTLEQQSDAAREGACALVVSSENGDQHPNSPGATPSVGEESAANLVNVNKADILSMLFQHLGRSPGQSLPLSVIREYLPPSIQTLSQDTEKICEWLKDFNGLIELTGLPGEEVVTMTLGRLPGEKATQASASSSSPDAGICTPVGSTVVAPKALVLGSAPGPRNIHLLDAVAPATSTAAADPSSSSSLDGGRANLDSFGEDDALNPSTVQLRGLPFRATVADVKTFLGEHAKHLIATDPAVRLLLNRDGRPSGFARVHFTSPEAARICREQLHRHPMGDRYVEVLACSERAGKARHRRLTAGEDPDDGLSNMGALPNDAAERERILNELRDHMALPGRQHLLLSMLGIALSPPARNYLRRSELGLKQFLVRCPQEFRIDGPKGCERVMWCPQTQVGSAQMNAISMMPPYSQTSLGTHFPPMASFPPMFFPPQPVPVTAPSTLEADPFGTDMTTKKLFDAFADVPSTPKQIGPASIGTRRDGEASVPRSVAVPASAHLLATPSDWGTPGRTPGPGHVQKTPEQNAAQAQKDAASAAAAAASAAAAAALPWGDAMGWPAFAWQPAPWPGGPGAGGVPPSMTWPGAWPSWDPSATTMPGMGLNIANAPGTSAESGHSSTSKAKAKKQGGKAEGSSNRSHAHLHPQSHPFAHRQHAEAGAEPKVEPPKGAALRLRGLPFTLSEQDVYAFFSINNVSDRIVDRPDACQLLPKANGRPSGQAVVQMNSPVDAVVAQRALHNKFVGGRYVEVFVYTEEGEGPLDLAPNQADAATQLPTPSPNSFGMPGAPTVGRQPIGIPGAIGASGQQPLPPWGFSPWGAQGPPPVPSIASLGATTPPPGSDGTAAATSTGDDWNSIFTGTFTDVWRNQLTSQQASGMPMGMPYAGTQGLSLPQGVPMPPPPPVSADAASAATAAADARPTTTV